MAKTKPQEDPDNPQNIVQADDDSETLESSNEDDEEQESEEIEADMMGVYEWQEEVMYQIALRDLVKEFENEIRPSYFGFRTVKPGFRLGARISWLQARPSATSGQRNHQRHPPKVGRVVTTRTE